MEQSKVQELREKLQNSEEFKNELQQSESPEKLIETLEKNGYTGEEFLIASGAVKDDGAELSDDDLENVAGGSFLSDLWTGFKFGFTNPVEGVKAVISYIKGDGKYTMDDIKTSDEQFISTVKDVAETVSSIFK